MRKSEMGNGDKTHIELKVKGFVVVDKEKTEFDLEIDLTVDQLDYHHLTGALVKAMTNNGHESNRVNANRNVTKTRTDK